MLRWFRFRRALRKLRKTQEKIAASYAKDAQVAEHAKKKKIEIEYIWINASFENDFQEEIIRKIHTRYLQATADDMFVPVPYKEDDWADCTQTGGRCLTIQAANNLHREIRRERVERYQQVLQFLPFVTGLVGIIGALTGLLAVLKR